MCYQDIVQRATQLPSAVLLAAVLAAAPACSDDTPGGLISDAGPGSDSATPPPCEGSAGTFSEQLLAVDGEDRHYYLYVPDSYDCTQPWPVLVDLHGTAGPPSPETAYGLDAATEAAVDEGFVLVRPRSRYSIEGDTRIYRWDQNPGDPDLNAVFLRALLDHLDDRYHLDHERLYVAGFSSGTNQTAVMMAQADSPFSGYGHIGGGAWSVSDLPPSEARVFANTGFRDYMRPHHDNLMTMLDFAGHDPALRLVRDTNDGHELYSWVYREMWPFLDRGEAPASGELEAGWSDDGAPATAASLLTITATGGGDLLIGGESGLLFRRAGDTGEWSNVAIAGYPADRGHLTGLCKAGELMVAVGNGNWAASADGGSTWSWGQRLSDNQSLMGYSHLAGVACAPDRAVAVGHWSARQTNDGATWAQVATSYAYGRPQSVSVSASTWGTWIAVGYFNYLGRSTDGDSFESVQLPDFRDWLYDAAPVAASTWVAVGDGGNVLRSTNDGVSFATVREAADDRESLYAVSFRDQDTGLAVGRRCAAYLTDDGGLSWRDVSCGRDAFLADVIWLADGTALAVGHRGTALRFDPDDLAPAPATADQPTAAVRYGQPSMRKTVPPPAPVFRY